MRRHKGLVLASLILTAISSLFAVVPAYLLQPFVDEGMRMGTEPVSWKIPWVVLDSGPGFSWHRTELTLVKDVSANRLLLLLSFVAFLSVVLRSITIYFGGLLGAAFSNRAVKSLRVDLFQKLVALPMGFYHKSRSGELVSRATADLSVMQGTIASVLIGIIEYPLTALVFIIYVLFANFKMALLVFFVVPPIVGMARFFGKRVKKRAIDVQESTASVTSMYQEIILCLRVVQGFFRGETEVHKFSTVADRLYQKIMHLSRWHLGLGPLMDSVVFLVMPAILLIGKIYFQLTLGELISMMYAFSRAYSPIKKLGLVNNSLKTLQGATERVFGIMKTAPDIQNRPGAVELPRHREVIEYKSVYFGYTPNEFTVKDVSFAVSAGQMAAFVGSTGGGKTTLMDLVPRFYDVTRGSITIDGMDIRDVTLESLRKQIGIVNQEILMFNDTIERNICYGNPEIGTQEMVAAAKAADAHAFIMKQPKGYQTTVGDLGSLLSGGQRQRIAIARAIAVNPSILILDEAASALDAESERAVRKAVETLKGRLTILVVAHRLNTIMRADCVFVIEGGRIVESGSPDMLLTGNGRFRQLYELQFSN